MGTFYLVDGFALASGTYLPGPTEFGDDEAFLRALPLLNPNVYLGSFVNSGLSLGRYYGPGLDSKLFNYIYRKKLYGNILVLLWVQFQFYGQ